MELEQWGDWPNRESKRRVLVVNPLSNWWCYKFSMELALRLKADDHEVLYINLDNGNSQDLQVNEDDTFSRWQFKHPRDSVSEKLKIAGIEVVSTTTLGASVADVPTFHNLNALQRWKHEERDSGKIVSAAISGVLKQRNFDVSMNYSLVESYVEQYLIAARLVESMLVKHHIDLVATTNDRLLLAATALSEARNCRVETLIGYWGSDENRFVCYANSLYSPDDWRRHISWKWQQRKSTTCDDQAAEGKISEAAEGKLKSTQHFRHSMSESQEFSFSSRKKTLVFFPTTPWEYSGLVSRRCGDFTDQLEALEAILDALDPTEWDVVIRHHPPSKRSLARPELDVWEHIRVHSNVSEIPPDSTINSYRLLDAADMNAVWVSTIGAEAIARRRPVMVLGEPYWLDPSWEFAVPTRQRLTEYLAQPSPIPNPSILKPYFHFFEEYGAPFKNVGGTGAGQLSMDGDAVFDRTFLGTALRTATHVLKRVL